MPQPKVSYCLVCEDARLEQGNKLTILGLYGVLPSPELPLHIVLPDWPAAIRILFMVGMSNGSTVAVAQVVNPDGSILSASEPVRIAAAEGNASGLHFGFGFVPLIFTQQGKHFLRVLFDDTEVFKHPFAVSQGAIPTQSISASPSASPSPSSSASPSN